MLGSTYIYHKTLKLLKTHIFLADKVMICHYVRNVIMNVILLRYESVNHKWFINFITWRYITPRGDVV